MQQFEQLAPDGSPSEKIRAIINESFRLIQAAPGETALFVGATAGVGSLIDTNAWNAGGDFLVNILSLALGYVLVSAMLRKGGLAPDGLRNGFGTYFGIGLLSGIATIVGFLLLIVPGVVLLVRWSASYGYALVDGHGVTESMGQSWRETAAHFWPILAAMFMPAGVLAVGFVIYVFGFSDEASVNLFSIVAGNIVLMCASVAFSAVGLAVFSLLRNAGGDLEDVFA